MKRRRRRNIIDDLILDVFGGLTEAVVATGIPQSTWQDDRRRGYIRSSRRLFRVADLTGIEPRTLAGLDQDT